MNLNELRQIIRSTVRKQLSEAAGKKTPTTFNEFRKMLATALGEVGAPKELTSEVSDLTDDGGGATQSLWRTWENIDYELRDPDMSWDEIVDFYVYDAVIDMVESFQQPMNYGPGEKKGKKPIDAGKLAQLVVKAMKTGLQKAIPVRR